ncbi:PREDICTED: uncharacterized protein LOC106818254 [Priapulus caudatus]|uniref:Uncharacterized protein LOC106818254 n=1 Tax=Priapulus caudatus TaxID=37621 RepID=A0ABM1F1Z4_PRICU|nr:PREDICTED: uncharacterized protein LOC106818254 [Priapulus caudatus]
MDILEIHVEPSETISGGEGSATPRPGRSSRSCHRTPQCPHCRYQIDDPHRMRRHQHERHGETHSSRVNDMPRRPGYNRDREWKQAQEQRRLQARAHLSPWRRYIEKHPEDVEVLSLPYAWEGQPIVSPECLLGVVTPVQQTPRQQGHEPLQERRTRSD